MMNILIEAKAKSIPSKSHVRAQTGLLQRKCACGQHTVAGGECAECRKKRLQRKAAGHTDPETAPPIVHEVLRSPGQPLDAGTQAFMEPRFGHDFSQVRVHTDARAAESARAVNALAYTVGNHIAFDAGRYAPSAPAGRRLLTHELAHVVQQSAMLQTMPTSVPIEAATTSLEHQADRASEAVMAGRSPQLTPTASPTLSLQRRRDTFTAPDGTQITRTITPGVCRRRPTTRRSSRADVGQREAFFEVDACRGTSGETLRGTLDYSDVIQRFGDLITRLQSQRDPQQALRDFENTVRQSTPRAQIRYTLQFDSFRFQTTAGVGGNLGGGREVTVNGLLRYTNGQFTIHLEAGHQIDFAGGEGQGSNTTLVLNTDLGPVQIRFSGGLRSVAGAEGDTETLSGTGSVVFPLGGGLGIGLQGSGERTTTPGGTPTQSGTIQIVFGTFPRLEQERGRDCFVCSCDDPNIVYTCEEPDGDTPRTPAGPPRMTRYFPLFYEYAQADPRPDWQQRYTDTLAEVVTWLERGYTISRIEGRTSPEGPLRQQRPGGFEGNIRLAERRAERARDDLLAAIRAQAGGLLVMRRERLTPGQRNLQDSLSRPIRLVGHAPGSGPESAELFGSAAGQEVSEADLFRHLSRVLQPPDPDQPDLLAQEHVLGEGLPTATRQETTTAVEAFRGQASGRRLSESQRLEQLFRVLRRALIVLEPPVIRREDIFLSDERLRDVLDRIEAETLCSQRQEDQINREIPLQGEWLFDVQCEER